MSTVKMRGFLGSLSECRLLHGYASLLSFQFKGVMHTKLLLHVLRRLDAFFTFSSRNPFESDTISSKLVKLFLKQFGSPDRCPDQSLPCFRHVLPVGLYWPVVQASIDYGHVTYANAS
jgi:hypothetical protein